MAQTYKTESFILLDTPPVYIMAQTYKTESFILLDTILTRRFGEIRAAAIVPISLKMGVVFGGAIARLPRMAAPA